VGLQAPNFSDNISPKQRPSMLKLVGADRNGAAAAPTARPALRVASAAKARACMGSTRSWQDLGVLLVPESSESGRGGGAVGSSKAVGNPLHDSPLHDSPLHDSPLQDVVAVASQAAQVEGAAEEGCAVAEGDAPAAGTAEDTADAAAVRPRALTADERAAAAGCVLHRAVFGAGPLGLSFRQAGGEAGGEGGEGGEGSCVLVSRVGGQALAQGVQPGDAIDSIGPQRVGGATQPEVLAIFKGAARGAPLVVRFRRRKAAAGAEEAVRHLRSSSDKEAALFAAERWSMDAQPLRRPARSGIPPQGAKSSDPPLARGKAQSHDSGGAGLAGAAVVAAVAAAEPRNKALSVGWDNEDGGWGGASDRVSGQNHSRKTRQGGRCQDRCPRLGRCHYCSMM